MERGESSSTHSQCGIIIVWLLVVVVLEDKSLSGEALPVWGRGTFWVCVVCRKFISSKCYHHITTIMCHCA